MFSLLADETDANATTTGRHELLRDLAAVVGAANQPADLARVRNVLISTADPLVAFPLALGLGDGLRRSGSSFEKAGVNLESLLGRAAATGTNTTAPESARLEAVALLAFGHDTESEKTLLPLLEPQQPRLHHHGAPDRQLLLLAAGKIAAAPAQHVAQHRE